MLDTFTGLVGLTLALPFIAVTAALIKLTSRGPVYFVQERIGEGGEPFNVIKFRTMRDGTHDEVLTNETDRRRYIENDFKLAPDDPRITRIGAVLRKTSLDELPQLINVIRGEMSVVGVRPLLGIELEQRPLYDQECYRSMKPGMTGLWQVEGRSRISHEDRFALDRRYVEQWGFWSDVKLLLRTPAAVLRTDTAH